MDKIKALLEKAGVNPTLSVKICESLGNYKATLREQFEKEYAAKVEQAKRVCIEETEAHKRELARRVQIFCETKGAAIEAQLAKQSALNESEALTKLTQISALLEGLEPNGKPSGNVTAVVEKLKRHAQIATEERNRAIKLANRRNAIAEKALKHNRQLVAALQNLQEQRAGGERRPVTESRSQGQQQSRRIDQSRNAGRTRSTRATLKESQDRRPPARPNQSHVSGTGNGNGFSIDQIASSIDEDLV